MACEAPVFLLRSQERRWDTLRWPIQAEQQRRPNPPNHQDRCSPAPQEIERRTCKDACPSSTVGSYQRLRSCAEVCLARSGAGGSISSLSMQNIPEALERRLRVADTGQCRLFVAHGGLVGAEHGAQKKHGRLTPLRAPARRPPNELRQQQSIVLPRLPLGFLPMEERLHPAEEPLGRVGGDVDVAPVQCFHPV